MPNKPVDLTHLREFTDGYTEMEKQLFELFISSSEECLRMLERYCTEGENKEWKNQAHALKGAAMNMGANAMAEVCAKAQEAFTASQRDKAAHLQNIWIAASPASARATVRLLAMTHN